MVFPAIGPLTGKKVSICDIWKT